MALLWDSQPATDIRKNINWLASYEITDINQRVLEVGERAVRNKLFLAGNDQPRSGYHIHPFNAWTQD